MRPYWTGQIRVSLVSFGVEIYSALDRGSQIGMHMIHEPSGERVHYQHVVRRLGPVRRDEIVKGYEYEPDRYVIVEPQELERIRLESKKTIDIVQFAAVEDVPELFFDKPYFVQPEKGETAEEAYQVIRKALARQRKLGVGQMYRAGREYLVALKAYDGGLLLQTLRYADEVRDAERFYRQHMAGRIDADKLELAEALIEKKTRPFEPAAFADHYRAALRELIEAKLEARVPHIVEERASERTVVDLMEALKRSVEQPARPKGRGGRRAA